MFFFGNVFVASGCSPSIERILRGIELVKVKLNFNHISKVL